MNNPIEEAKVFSKEVCGLNPDDYSDSELFINYNIWLKALDFSMESAPYYFEIGKKVFHSSYIKVGEQYIPNLLAMKLKFLIELVSLEYDVSKFHLIDNIAALMYREDWSKPFSIQEYFDNAKMFEGLECKYSFWGVEKFNELIVTLKDTYPILYQDNNDDKTDSRKMFDMVNAISGDSPINRNQAENVELSEAFEWMEFKKKESIKKQLNNK